MHFYSSSHIDRAADRRLDGAWLAAALGDQDSVVVPVRGSDNLIRTGEDPCAVLLSAPDIVHGIDGEAPVFLGVGPDDRAYFAVGIGDDQPSINSALSGEGGGDELEDARWFSRQDIVAGVEAGDLRISPKISISRHLIDDWLGSG